MLVRLWSKLITKGINTLQEKPEKRRHVLTNQYTMFSVLLASVWCLGILLLQKSTLLLPSICTICYGLCCYLLTINGFRNSSRFLLLTGNSLLIFYLSKISGPESGVHFLFFPLMTFSLLLFNPASYYLLLGNTAISLMLLLILNESNPSTVFTIYENNTVSSSYIILFIVSSAITISNLIRFLRAQSQSVKTSDKYNSSLLSIIENSSDGILLLDENWGISEFNSSFSKWHQKVTGFPLTKRDDVYVTLKALETTSPGVTGRWITNIKKAFSGQQFNIIETCSYLDQPLTLDIHFNPVINNNKINGICIYFRNITAQIAQQQTLEQHLAENKKLALIVNKTDKAIVITDCNFRIEWLNESFTRLCGYTKEECVGRRIQELTGESYPDNNNAESYMHELDRGLAVTVETVCTNLHQQQKWLSSNITPVFNDHQVCEKFIIVKTDITAFKKKEKELQNSCNDARKMALVAQNSDISVIITDKNNIIEWINEGFIKFFGFDESICLGKKASDILRGSMTTLQMMEKYAEKLQSGRHFTHEMILYTNLNESRWAAFNVTPFFNEKDELEKYICIITDITSAKQQEEQIRKLLIQDKDRIWMNIGLAKLGDVLRENQSEADSLYAKTLEFLSGFTGAARTEIISVHINSHHSTDQLLLKSYGELLCDLKPCISFPFDPVPTLENNSAVCEQSDMTRYHLKGTDNTEQLQQIYSVKIQDDSQGATLLVLYSSKTFTLLQQQFLQRAADNIAQTIELVSGKQETEKLLFETQALNRQLKNREEELHNSIVELNRQSTELHASQTELQSKNKILSDKTKELETAREALHIKASQLEQSNRFKSEFLANMSHELRTPLNSIIILSRLLFENKENTLNKRQLDFARVVNKSGDDLLSLINDILDLSKIEAGKIELEITTVETEEIAQDMMALFNEVARDKKINFAVTTEPGLPEAFLTDGARTGQILKNLLSNAFKFTPEEGSVCLNISCINNTIEFKVIDTGSGIAEDKLHLIFEAFRQADGSVNRKYGGTGLGLSISKELTVMLNGTIKVESQIGKGSVFTLTLPLTTNDSSVVTASPYSALIVEDNENENHMIKHVMEKQGYHCLAAFGIGDAMKLILENKVHVLILDLNLPDGCGLEILKYVKETPQLTDISIIIYTSRDLVPAESSLLESYSNIIIKKENKSILTLQEETIRFLRKIPLRKTEHNIEKSGLNPEIIHLKGKNILIVDDDERNIYAISHTLEGQEMNIFKASTGMEAIRQLQINPEIDLVLMDVMMPDMDGIETVKQIRSDLSERRIPIIAVTAKAMKEDRELCLSAGMDEYITKPVDTNRLLSVMNSFFE
ncbi:MAG: response regulator [Bacteroidota bacterium]